MAGTRVRRPRAAVLSVAAEGFADGDRIPDRFALGGENRSPALRWAGLPAGTASVALLVEDPDAPGEEPFTHWILFNLRPDRPGLPEGVPRGPRPEEVQGAVHGLNDFGRTGYDGPAPPPGDGPHRYRYRVFALDARLTLPPGATRADLLDALPGHVLARGEVVGLYARP